MLFRVAETSVSDRFAISFPVETDLHGDGGLLQIPFPQNLRLSFGKIMDLRYGENPHQKAAMYSDGSGTGVKLKIVPSLKAPPIPVVP